MISNIVYFPIHFIIFEAQRPVFSTQKGPALMYRDPPWNHSIPFIIHVSLFTFLLGFFLDEFNDCTCQKPLMVSPFNSRISINFLLMSPSTRKRI